MLADTVSMSRRSRVLQPGSYTVAGVTICPPKPKRPREVERASALLDLQFCPKLRAAFVAWALSIREKNPAAKANLTKQFDRLFYELDGHQMLKLAHVIEMVRGKS